MIDSVRDLFAMDDPDGDGPDDLEVAADDAREQVRGKVPRGMMAAVAEGVVERGLRRDPDDGPQECAALLVDAVEAYHDPGHSGPRDEARRRDERETLTAIRDRIDDRLAEINAEREAAERRTGWAWMIDGAGMDGHPQEEAIREALERVHDRLRDAGADGLTAEELHEAFRGAYRGNRSATVTSAKEFWRKWGTALPRAPGVTFGPGAWTAAPGDMVPDPRTVEIDGRPLDEYDPTGDRIARMYEALADGPATSWDLADAAAPQGRAPGAETVTALETEPVVAGRTALDVLAALPGVDAPDEDAPLLRYVGDDDGDDGDDGDEADAPAGGS